MELFIYPLLGKKGLFNDNEKKQRDLVSRLQAMPVAFDSFKRNPGVKMSNPKIHLGFLRCEKKLKKFIEVFEWELKEIKAS